MNADLLRLLAEATGRPRPPRCLELGCGDGAACFWLAERGCDVIGVDLALPLPRGARVTVSDVGPGLAVLINDDVLGVELEGPFDVVSALGLLHSLGSGERVTRALERLAGWTAPDGRVLLSWLLDVTPVTPSHVGAHFPSIDAVAGALGRFGFSSSVSWETRVQHAHGGPVHRHRVVYSSWRRTR